MGTLSALLNAAAASPFWSPEEDPFLLLESTLRSVQEILIRRRGLPLWRTWIEQLYGDEDVTLLEEAMLPALQSCLEPIDEIDAELEAQQKAKVPRIEAERATGLVLASGISRMRTPGC